MNLKPLFIAGLLTAISFQCMAQTLYMPREIKKAYDNGTRSMDGTPGKNYWQNTGRYNISVTVAPPNRLVRGSEQITYVNNSPDTLHTLHFKVINNIHKPGAERFFGAGKDYLGGGITVDTLTINGETNKWDNESVSTNQSIKLTTPLAPHDSLKLTVAWHYGLVTGHGREGVIDSTSFYLAYFYPRVAVFDDYKGWDRDEFNDALEFYNDFNDYRLSVTVPKNFIVWATGTLQNAAQVLQPEYLARLNKSYTSDSTVHIATAQDLAAKKITTQSDMNTWVWTATHITDMAVGISDSYDWDGASVVVDDAAHRRVSMQAAFGDTSKDFYHAVQYGRHTLDWLSHNLPGVPYPFPKMTAFEGFADMEYPMMVNDSHESELQFAEFVQDHEIAHTYFPFYMGINETRYGFMDEGWATTFELLLGTTEVGRQKAEDLYKGFRIDGWIHSAATGEDLPIITPGTEQREGLGDNEYGKPSLSYFALKDMLGEPLFKKALQTYMANWHGKHPIPWDYFNSMNTGSGRNLNWFFNNWFFTHNYIDLAFAKGAKSSDGYTFTINNIGGFVVPFDLIVTYTDGATASFHQTPAVWEQNQVTTTVTVPTTKAIKSAKIDGGIFMDADESNNVWTAE
jgi:hypothetical protein